MARHPQRYATLDGIRGLAATAVLLFHGGLSMDCPWIVGHGALAVDVFFAMSGFVVERAYGTRLREGWSRKAFAATRLVRLYPLYLVGILLGLTLQIFQFALKGQPIEVAGLGLIALIGALLIPLLRGGNSQLFPLDAPCWSLLIEALANIGFAILPRWKPGLLAAGVLVAALELLSAGFGGVSLLLGGTSGHLLIDLARGAFGFGSGMLISRAEAGGRLDKLRGRHTALLMPSLLGLMLVPRGPADLWLDPLAILLCPVAVALAVVQAQPFGRLSCFCAWAGTLSYPLYILHAPLLKLAVELTPTAAGDLSSERGIAVCVAMACSVALAVSVGRWLEPAFVQATQAMRSSSAIPVSD